MVKNQGWYTKGKNTLSPSRKFKDVISSFPIQCNSHSSHSIMVHCHWSIRYTKITKSSHELSKFGAVMTPLKDIFKTSNQVSSFISLIMPWSGDSQDSIFPPIPFHFHTDISLSFLLRYNINVFHTLWSTIYHNVYSLCIFKNKNTYKTMIMI
jgi:hypothetical protein